MILLDEAITSIEYRETLNAEKTPHNSHLQASSGMSFVSVLQENYPHNRLKQGLTFNVQGQN